MTSHPTSDPVPAMCRYPECDCPVSFPEGFAPSVETQCPAACTAMTASEEDRALLTMLYAELDDPEWAERVFSKLGIATIRARAAAEATERAAKIADEHRFRALERNDRLYELDADVREQMAGNSAIIAAAESIAAAIRADLTAGERDSKRVT